MESNSMKKSLLCMITTCVTLPMMAHADSPYFSFKDGEGFKRFSISAGWLHAAPQGTANPLKNSTAVAEGTKSKVGDVSKSAVLDAAIFQGLGDFVGCPQLQCNGFGAHGHDPDPAKKRKMYSRAEIMIPRIAPSPNHNQRPAMPAPIIGS